MSIKKCVNLHRFLFETYKIYGWSQGMWRSGAGLGALINTRG